MHSCCDTSFRCRPTHNFLFLSLKLRGAGVEGQGRCIAVGIISSSKQIVGWLGEVVGPVWDHQGAAASMLLAGNPSAATST